jgi:tRNA G46 methylase TrmB
MKLLKQEFEEIVNDVTLSNEKVIKKCAKRADNHAIDFALFLSKNMYEDMYQDIDKDGKTWVCFPDDLHNNRKKAKRYTIEELLKKFEMKTRL